MKKRELKKEEIENEIDECFEKIEKFGEKLGVSHRNDIGSKL
jgi:hypothetical protein